MKKKMIYVVAALVLGAVTVFNVKTVLEANHVYDLTMTSIDALSENSDGESGESGGSQTGQYEYKDGAPYSSICNVSISKHKRCKVELIICQGGGSGCNSKKCPVHKS